MVRNKLGRGATCGGDQMINDPRSRRMKKQQSWFETFADENEMYVRIRFIHSRRNKFILADVIVLLLELFYAKCQLN
jgi:hypothetical protein